MDFHLDIIFACPNIIGLTLFSAKKAEDNYDEK